MMNMRFVRGAAKLAPVKAVYRGQDGTLFVKPLRGAAALRWWRGRARSAAVVALAAHQAQKGEPRDVEAVR